MQPGAYFLSALEIRLVSRFYAYNNRLSGDRRIGAVSLTLIKVADRRLGGTEKFRTEEGLTAVYSSRVRTLVDAVYDWSRFDSLPRAYEWIHRELGAGRVGASELVTATVRYGNQGTMRRIGALLESKGIPGRLLAKLRRALKPSASLIQWVPTLPRRCKADQRWGVVLNG